MLLQALMRTPTHEDQLQWHGPIPRPEKPLVLLVDDDHHVLDFTAKWLEAEGMSCLTASSVAEALSALQQNEISLAVLDWKLDRCGSEVLSAAKELFPKMPVIAISGMPCDVRTDAVVHKADAFLHKPLSATVLVGQVKQLLERTRREPAIPLPEKSEAILPLEKVQAIYIRHVVGLLAGNKSKAAEALGIHRQTVATALKNEAQFAV